MNKSTENASPLRLAIEAVYNKLSTDISIIQYLTRHVGDFRKLYDTYIENPQAVKIFMDFYSSLDLLRESQLSYSLPEEKDLFNQMTRIQDELSGMNIGISINDIIDQKKRKNMLTIDNSQVLLSQLDPISIIEKVEKFLKEKRGATEIVFDDRERCCETLKRAHISNGHQTPQTYFQLNPYEITKIPDEYIKGSIYEATELFSSNSISSSANFFIKQLLLATHIVDFRETEKKCYGTINSIYAGTYGEGETYWINTDMYKNKLYIRLFEPGVTPCSTKMQLGKQIAIQ